MSKYVCGKRLEESVNSFCSGCRAMSFCLPPTLWNFPLFSVMIDQEMRAAAADPAGE